MAEHEAEYHRGEMSISEQARTYEAFGEFSKWGSLIVAVLVLFPTLWFCTDFGFLGAAIVNVVMVAIGILVLRKGPGESH